MPVSTLDTTVGGASANAYVSLAEANQYHLDRPAAGTTWADASDDEKNAAILWATKLLDSLYEWNGYVVNETQALLWPRYGLVYRSGYTVPSDVIPDELKDATAEFARQLLAADRAGDSDIETLGITSLRAGPVALSFKNSVTAKVVPDAVYHLIPEEWGIPRGRERGYKTLVRV